MSMDVFQLVTGVTAIGLIAVGCWWFSPALSLVVVGSLLLCFVYLARSKDGRNARSNQ